MFERVLPDQLEHPEAWLAIGILAAAQEAFLGQGDHPLDSVQPPELLGGVDADAADERRQRCEQSLLGVLQQPIAPVEGRPEGSLAFGEVARAGG